MRRLLTGRVRRVSLIVGTAALLSLGALSFEVDEGNPDGDLAKGSGDSATGTQYVQPSVGAAQLGATATATSTPSSVEAVTKAVPPIKAS